MFRVPGDEVLILRLDRDDVTVEIRCTYTLPPGGKGTTHTEFSGRSGGLQNRSNNLYSICSALK